MFCCCSFFPKIVDHWTENLLVALTFFFWVKVLFDILIICVLVSFLELWFRVLVLSLSVELFRFRFSVLKLSGNLQLILFINQCCSLYLCYSYIKRKMGVHAGIKQFELCGFKRQPIQSNYSPCFCCKWSWGFLLNRGEIDIIGFANILMQFL